MSDETMTDARALEDFIDAMESAHGYRPQAWHTGQLMNTREQDRFDGWKLARLRGEAAQGEQQAAMWVRIDPHGRIDWAEDCVAPEPNDLLCGLEGQNYSVAPLYTRPKPVAVAGDAVRNWPHIANEWADMATSSIDGLKNIRDGISTVDEVLANAEQMLAHCREVNDAPALSAAPAAPAACDWPACGCSADGHCRSTPTMTIAAPAPVAGDAVSVDDASVSRAVQVFNTSLNYDGSVIGVAMRAALAQDRASQAGAAAPTFFPNGSRAEWQDNLGRWWPVTITNWHSATYSARLDDGTDALKYPTSRFRAIAAPTPAAEREVGNG